MVLPFANIRGDPEQDYFVDGVTESLTTDLSRIAHRWMFFAGAAKLWRGDDAEAVAWLRRSIEANRNFPLAHFHLATALALLGLRDEARAAAKAGLALEPGFTIRRFRAFAPSDHPAFLAGRERTYEGMRMAGVPEG